MTIKDDLFKIIGKGSGKIQFLCKDNPPFISRGMLEAYGNEIKKNLEILKSLLNNFDVIQPPEKGSTLLGYAAHCGWLEAVKYLVEEKGANVNEAGSKGTPLHEAAWRNIDVVLYLIERGAEVNHVNKNGRTPLHVAANFLGQFVKRRVSATFCEFGFFRQVDLIQSLLAAGAKVQEDNDGKTPLDLTDSSDAPEGLKLLIVPTLLSNPNINKPNSIEKNQELSAYWDTEQKKINFLLNTNYFGKNNYTINTLNLYSRKDSLSALSFNKFFDSLNHKKIKDENSCEAAKSVEATVYRLGQ